MDRYYADSISRQRVARQIAKNDPGLTSLTIGLSDHFPPQFGANRLPGFLDTDDDAVDLWESLGADVARNTHLTELVVGDFYLHFERTDKFLEAFFRGAVGNRSIQELILGGSHKRNDGTWRHFPGAPICKSLAKFLDSNGKIERLKVEAPALRNEQRGEHILILAMALRVFGCLTSFSTTYDFSDRGMDAEFQQLVQALSGHTNLRGLVMAPIADIHFATVASSLMGPRSKLEELSLRWSVISDEGIEHLANALGNNTLRNLNLSYNRRVTADGWVVFMRALSPILQKHDCALAALDLEGCDEMDDDAVRYLANSLKGNTSVKELDLRLNRGVTCQGWAAFSEALAFSAVEKLDLAENSFDDSALFALTSSLVNNSKMKTLSLHLLLDHLGDNRAASARGVTARGWSTFSRVLSSPESVLEDLDISENALLDDATLGTIANNSLISNTTLKAIDLYRSEITDVTLTSLANALVVNTRVKRLDLFCSGHVTSDGWAAFAQILSPVLQNNTSSLERMNLEENRIDDRAAIHFANALVSNNKLKELNLDAEEDAQITSNGCAAFARTLGNTQSIADTYNSNHALETLLEEFDLLDDLLRMNRSLSESEAARLKIVKIHFPEGFATQPFVDMDIKVLPHALSWMARDERELGHFWGFVKSMPSLFGVGSDGKKRKRGGKS